MKKTLIWDYTEFNHAREPIIRKMPDNSLICLTLTGGETEPRNENVVMITRSYDDGESWSRPEILFSHSSRGVWATEVFTEGEYPMAVVHTYNAKSHYRELMTFCSYTKDNGLTWSEPHSFPSGLDNVSLRQGIVLSNGSWLFPLYFSETQDNFDWDDNVECNILDTFRTSVAISDDKGKSYTRHGYFHPEGDVAWEPNAIELENGHVLLYMRINKTPRIYMAESFDYGKTWTEAKFSDIPNSCTKITLAKTKGKILLINNFAEKERNRLELWISSDNTKTWEKKIPLAEPDVLFYYPHCCIDEKSETVYIAYENAKQHYLTKLKFSEIFD